MRKHLLLLLLLILSMPLMAQNGYTRYTNLPAVYITTFDGYGITSKTEYKYCTLRYVDEQNNVTTYDSVQIRGRGNSTWNMSKKPYRIKFHSKERFLGKERANAKSWTLLANAGDKTLIRNAVTSAMGEFLGLDFNPAYKFVDLNVNGTYYGNYQISDQMEVRKKRVDIVEQDFPLSEGSNITGGYFLEVDGFQHGNYFTTSGYGVPIRIHSPDEDEIEESQNKYIRNYIKGFENALIGASFIDPEKGYRKWVDSVSLANWYIATEVSANIDGFYSTYFYKNQDDSLLYWGPLWDYDIAYGNDSRMGDTRRQLMSDVGYGKARLWVERMWDDIWFHRLINRRFKEAVEAGLEAHMQQTIDSLSTLLERSQQRNYQKWGISTRMYRERVLYSSYDQYISDLKEFIPAHIEYLQKTFANKKPDEPTPPFEPGNYYYKITNAGNSKAIDIEGQSTEQGSKICLWDDLTNRESEQWEFVKVDDYFMIINRMSKMALHDPTVGASTATTNIGARLTVDVPNENDTRQHWTLTPQGTKGYYNLTNRYSKHTANLSGGSKTNGASITSYTTDARNASSNNRLWSITADEIIDEPYFNDIAQMPEEPEEYALAYDPLSQTLHFGSETPDKLTFMVDIHTTNGTKVAQFRADERFSTIGLPKAVYIVSWQVGGKRRSTKFSK